MIPLVFFIVLTLISEMNGWHIVLWSHGISSIFYFTLKMRLCDDWKNESDKQEQQQEQQEEVNCSPFIRLLIITFWRWLNQLSGFMKSLNSLKDSRFRFLFFTHVSFWKLNHRLKTNEHKWTKSKENSKILSQVSWDHMLRTNKSF